MKCECSWIDSQGNPTPDHDDAIAMAVCYDPVSFGEKGSDSFPICERHAKQKGKFWKLLPLPEDENLLEWHPLVFQDVNFKIIPDVVIASIKQAFPDQAKEILEQLHHSGDHFSFVRWGMYVGVEYDGYIHT